MMFGIQGKEFKSSYFSWAESPAFWQTPGGLFFYRGMTSVRTLNHTCLIGEEMVVFLKGSPLSTEQSWSSI